MGGSWMPEGTSVHDIDPDIFTGFLERKIPGLTDTQRRAGEVAEEGWGGMKNMIQRSTGRQAGYMDAYAPKQGVSTERRRGFQDEYKGLTQGGGQEMVDRFKAGGAGMPAWAQGGVGGKGGGGGGFNWSGGGGGPSGASAEAVAEAKRFQEGFGAKNEDIQKALGLQGEGRAEAQAFARLMGQDTKYDEQAQELFKKYEGEMGGRHDMDAKTAALYDELKGQMLGNQYQDEAAGLIRSTTGDIIVDETSPQMQAANKLFNMTQGAQLTNQMAAAGLGRGAARADVQGRAWATQMPALIQNQQQFELAQDAAQRDAANQMFGMGQAESQRAAGTFGAGQAANADIASRERGIQQALMGQGIGMNMQQSQNQRQAQQAGYGAQAQALQAQAQAAMQAGDASKARELSAQASLMNAFGMRSGSEDAAAARGASMAGQENALRAQMYGQQLGAYGDAEQRALDAMMGRQGSLENMFNNFTRAEEGISADELASFGGLTGANERMLNQAGTLWNQGSQQAFDNISEQGALEQQNLMDQFNYDSSEFDRLRALFSGGVEGSTTYNPAPLLGTKTSGGGKK